MSIEAAKLSEIPQDLIINYPIGADAIATVVRPLFANLDQTWDEYLNLKAPILDVENPYANGYLMALSNNFSGLENEGFSIGVTLAYEIFKEKAGKQKLPVLSLEFVQVYDAFAHDRLTIIYGNYPGSRILGADKEEEIRRGLFVMLEKEAYQALEQEMTEQNQSIIENSIFSGIVASYFLFREGFSDQNCWE